MNLEEFLTRATPVASDDNSTAIGYRQNKIAAEAESKTNLWKLVHKVGDDIEIYRNGNYYELCDGAQGRCTIYYMPLVPLAQLSFDF